MMDSHRDEIAKLETLYANNPEGRVFTHLAEAYRKGGQLERAREILENGLQRHPDYASAHVVLGRVLVDFGDSTNAANEFRRVLELDRHNLVALRSLGDLARGSRRVEEALYYYGELAVLDPSDMGIQDEIRRLRADLAVTDAAAPDAGTTPAIAPEPGVEPAAEKGAEAGSPESTDAPALEAGADEESIEAVPEPDLTGPDEPVGVADAAVAGLVGATDGGEPASEPEVFTAAAGPSEVPEVESLDGLEERAGWAEVGGQDEPTADQPSGAAFGAGYGDVVGGEADLSGVRLDPAFAETGEAETAVGPADAVEPQALAEAGGDAAGAVADQLEAAGGVEPPVEAGPEGPAELSQEESEARGVAWHEVEGRWTGDQPPSDPEAERRADLGDPGEWIPAERWEWVAASADLTSDEAAAAAAAEAADPDVTGQEPFGEMTEETSFAGLVDEPPTDATGAGEDVDEDTFAAAGVGAGADDGSFGEDTGTPFGTPAELETEQGLAAEFEAAGPEAEALLHDGEAEGAALVESEQEAEPVAGSAATGEAAGYEPEAAWPVAATPDGGDWTDAADDDEGDQVITETLAEIYASQGLYERAAAVYRRLVTQRPADDRLQARLAELERTTPWGARTAAEPAEAAADEAVADVERSDRWLETVESAWTGGGGAVGTADTPYAWTAEPATEEPTGERVGQFFRSLLDWRPTDAGAPEDPTMRGTATSDAGPPGHSGMHDAAEPESALDEWFAPAEAESAADGLAEAPPGGDEDLEMFRSWLKSLKK